MMRRLAPTLITLVLAGCCAGRGSEQGVADACRSAVPAPVVARPAAALVFAPPMICNEPVASLQRGGREPEAFVAWEQFSTTFSYLRIDDKQTGDDRERFERRSVTERIGTSSR